MPNKTRKLHWAFLVSILLKGLNGILETLLGLVFLTTGSLKWMIHRLSQQELIADPHGWLAIKLHAFLANLSVKAQHFAAVYLLAHGIIKIILVWGLLRDRRWAFPVSLVLLSLFVAYQLLRFASTHSLILLTLASFDIIVIWLIWREYKKVHDLRTA